MKIQQIRNATLKISFAGKTILTDPMLLEKHGIASFAGKQRNPVVELPIPAEDVIRGVEMVLISHLHQDHFDAGAKELLPKDIPLFCRPGHEDAIRESKFSRVTPIDTFVTWEGIEITRTKGRHAGNPKWENILGKVAGFILKAANEPLVYWAGDTILCEAVETLIKTVKPDIILTHSCGAVLDDSGPIVMNAQMTMDLCKLMPEAVVIATHMEALDHAMVTRKDLRDMADERGITASQLLIPEDGEIMIF
ncbi:MAG: MBL fold metallo-hydrolase [Proteobacteria bacterium]|nr:MBL fold metallo-hydrolase [Desulfobacula sp.]MBU3951982.1 MBL fold metallo-hydrolase [Pseudomonadota bacterium]MBU4133268.1 MBL fold metallo-hydrolase [Pseudomonadota bacterium]